MSYVDDNLIKGEVVVHQARFHWWVFVKPAIGASFTILLFTFGAAGGGFGVGVLTALLPGMMTTSMLLNALVYYRYAEFSITNKRVVVKLGLVGRTTSETMLTQVEGLNFDQDLLARILNFGTFSTSGTGGKPLRLPYVIDPVRFRKALSDALDAKGASPQQSPASLDTPVAQPAQ